MKHLYIGDPHIQVKNLDESNKLMLFIHQTILSQKPSRVVILGDLLHTHSLIRAEVLDFWDHWLDTLSDSAELIVLVGNHDQVGDFNSDINSLQVFNRIEKDTLQIVQEPLLSGPFAYVSYHHDQKEFVEASNDLANKGAKVLVCHQTFHGAKFDNGMFAPDGIDPTSLQFDQIICGHIHTTAEFGNVFLPGTPKWDSASDANKEKGIWMIDHDETTGAILNKTFISTSHVCTPIVSLSWKEGETIPTFPENAKVSIELVGSSTWITKQKSTLKGKVNITTKITDKKERSDRSNGGTFEKFINDHFVTKTNKQELMNKMKEYGLV